MLSLLLAGASAFPYGVQNEQPYFGPRGALNRTTYMWTYFHGNDIPTVVAAIKAHPKALSAIGVIAYIAELDGTFGCMTPEGCQFYETGIKKLREAVPTLEHLPTISLPPGYIGTGMNLMLKNPTLQRQFIADALSKAKEWKYIGYNIDWEASADQNLLKAFLGNFGAALRKEGLVLTYDGVYSAKTYVDAGVDRFNDMGTYGQTGSTFENTIVNEIKSVGADHYCVGFDADTQSAVNGNFQTFSKRGGLHVGVWEDEMNMVSAEMWTALEKFYAGTI